MASAAGDKERGTESPILAARPGMVIGIGASAGGLEAYRSFFSAAPVDTGMAFVLIQHLSPDYKSMLAELLDKTTAMDVIQAVDGVEVKPNCVFVIPPDATMTIGGGCLKIVKPAPPRDRRRPIDTFFQSLAEDQGENAVCIILAGTGSDGTLGVAAIKEHGGLTLAQAEYDDHALAGMPQSAAASGQVDDVLAVEDMPARLVAYQKHLRGVSAVKDGDGTRTDAASHLSTIMAALRARVGHDFSGYKEKTLVRRLQRRMQLLEVAAPEAYIELYGEHPEELDHLFQEVLIGVTQFFRDPASFEALDATVLKGLVAGKGADETVRVWVPGCSTGQEAYTIAILLREAMDKRRARPKIQIFGTDIDDRAIAIARLGRYRQPIAGISPEHLERWFAPDGDQHCVNSEIREMCVFSSHSIIKHPPFSKLDLISCRNLLIYIDPALQERVMRTFHYALKPDGRLFLGSSESVTRSTALFAATDKKHRIFERRAIENASLPDIPSRGTRPDQPSTTDTAPAVSRDHIDRSARQVMEKYYPPHLVIDQRHQIVRFSGGAMGDYLEPAPGAPSFALFDILRKPLRPAVRAALQDVQASNAPTRHENVRVRIGDSARMVTIIAERMKDDGADFIVLAFQDAGSGVPDVATSRSEKNVPDTMRAIEQELQTTRVQLQSTIDELEIAGEEMKSSNEEYQSVNEELQSSNEELETSKEEMQSINEELQTINVEMASKNDQLMRLNSDLKNLLDSSEIATLFLDDELRIKRFSPGVTDIFHVRDNDIGRPIAEVVNLLTYVDLQRDVKYVLRKLEMVERQVTLKDAGMTFVLRIRPYRTIDNVIDGVVLTFVDITSREAADAALRETQDYLRLLIDSVADAVYCVDREGVTTLCNAAFLRMLGFDHEKEVIGAKLHDVIHHSHPDGSPYPSSQCPIFQTAQSGEEAHRDDEVFFCVDGTSVPVEYWVRPILRGGELTGAVCTFVDISDRRQAEERQGLLLKEMDHRIKNLFAIVGGVVTLSARSSSSPQEMKETIDGRLAALASAHLLIRVSKSETGTRQDVTLGALVGAILAPYFDLAATGIEAQIIIEGPEVPIGGEAVTSFALVLHELATNAAKYGALATLDGRIRINWSLKEGNLALTWQERGGPVVRGPPEREGFGSMLARRSVNGQLGGQLSFDWDAEGLTVDLSVPAERLKP